MIKFTQDDIGAVVTCVKLGIELTILAFDRRYFDEDDERESYVLAESATPIDGPPFYGVRGENRAEYENDWKGYLSTPVAYKDGMWYSWVHEDLLEYAKYDKAYISQMLVKMYSAT